MPVQQPAPALAPTLHTRLTMTVVAYHESWLNSLQVNPPQCFSLVLKVRWLRLLDMNAMQSDFALQRLQAAIENSTALHFLCS